MSSETPDVTLPVRRTTGDTLEERMSANAYEEILPARYLETDADGELVEEQEDLFERVAKNIALAEVVYEAEQRGIEITVHPDDVKPDHPRRAELVDEVFETASKPEHIDETALTEENVSKFAYDTIVDEDVLPGEIYDRVVTIKSEFQAMMERLQFIPNSPTLMNAGGELQQLSACFVLSPDDDINDIHETAKQAAEIFQSGGGCGYGFWKLRPFGDAVGSTGGIASGPITFMRTYDRMCETIAQGGSRRGAQMGIMRISHPDIIQFIHAKNKDVSLAHTLRLNDPDDYTHSTFAAALDEARELIDDEGRVPEHLRNAVEGHLSNFNISVGITDGFMEAVKAEEDYTFTNPRTGEAHIATAETKELYSRFGLGEYVTPGDPLSVPAAELWERIVEGAHENGEPGIVFLDRINDDHSFPVESTPTGDSSEHEILATNPCGEQPLMENEACNLGHINLSTIVAEDAPDWREWYDDQYGAVTIGAEERELAVNDFLEQAIDWDEFDRRIWLGTRFLENVATMSDFPISEIEETVRRNRKIGLGIMGLAQLYIQLGVEYGSEAGNEIAKQVMTHINHESKYESHKLATERGAFANWDDSKYASPTDHAEWFERQTGLDATEYPNGFVIRNHNTTTIAPTGTTSMVANTTGGCEPIYNVAYYKNVSDDVQGDEMLVEFDDYFLDVLEANDIDIEAVKTEAQEQMAANQFDGIDSLSTVPDAIGELFVTTDELSAREHAAVQCACQHGVDSAISKTVNAPPESTLEDAKDVFEWVYDHDGKGVTYYRDGTRSKQVLTTRADNAEFADEDEAADILLEQIADVFGGLEQFLDDETVADALDDDTLIVSGSEASTATADAESEPEAPQFAEKKPRPDALCGVSQRIDTGYGKVYVTINEDPETGQPFELFANIGQSGGFTNSFTEALAKVISTALRSGVDPKEITDELCGTRSPKVGYDRTEPIQSIPDAIGTALERYLNDEVENMTSDQQPLSDAEPEPDELTPGTTVDLEPDDDPDASPDGGTTADATDELLAAGELPECPDCGSMALEFSEGCQSCGACGWSKC